MRSIIHTSRLRALSQASAFLAFAGVITGCSSDASRLDQMLTASVATTSNQAAVINSDKALNQPYPGDVASRVRAVKRDTADRAEYYRPGPIAPPVTSSSLPSVSHLSNGATLAKRTVTPPTTPRVSSVTKIVNAPKSTGPIVLQPRQLNASPLKMSGTDTMPTGSVVSTPTPKVSDNVGWKNTKGATVTVQPGETLFNLSRRYGVPVSAIMNANNITDANSVEAGRRILIPTYNYANSVPVSAPDNDPVTRASRASRGFQGQARGRIAVPKARVAPPKVAVVQPAKVRPVATGRYTVVSGDTLYGIALRHGTTSAAIRNANNMSNDTVKLGQTLAIPGRATVAHTVNNATDKTVTGSIPKPSPTPSAVHTKDNLADQTASIAKRSTEKVATPKKASSTSFRWPAQGRLITRFGERDTNGTNDGIDISIPEGTPIKASENGTVIYSGSELEDFGKLILVSHSGGWVSAYAHASAALVRRGDKVRRGQVIAKSGRTGNATVPKLHFELRKNSNPVNPLNHLAK